MTDEFMRTQMLLGQISMEKLRNTKVAIFGVGGVGSFVVEALARTGIFRFFLGDADTVEVTNINRQIHATTKTLGIPTVTVMKERILEINPKAIVDTMKAFYLPENSDKFLLNNVDYLVDAVDTIAAKIHLVLKAKEYRIPVISCMGVGNKLDPTQLTVGDIYETSGCPLAKVMRRELKRRGVSRLKVVYSQESSIKPNNTMTISQFKENEKKNNEEKVLPKRHIPGSIAFVPSVAGLIMASEIVKDIVELDY